MSDVAEQWAQLVDRLAPAMTAEWGKNAREHGQHPWIRLVLLVDAHDFLCRQGPTEKIAMTMADLADGNDDLQKQGWEALVDHAHTQRVEIVTVLVDEGPKVLPPDLLGFFERSIEPSAHFR